MKMDKRKTFILVLGVITVLCIIGGTWYHVSKFKNYVKDSIEYRDEEYNEYEENNIIPSFDSVRIDGYVMEIEVISGDSYSYDISYNHSSLEPIVKMEGDTLVIEQTRKPKLVGVSPICRAIVTVPSKEVLSEVKIDSNIGEVLVDSINAKEVRIETNIGQVTLKNIESDDIRAESNIGEVEVELKGNIEDYNIELSTNLGETKVDGEKEKKSYKRSSSSNKEVRVETNIGEIKIY